MTEESTKKRQRVSRACEGCRQKKIKCRGSPPTCNNCLTLGLTCHYLASTKKRGPPKGYIEAIEGRLQRLEALLGTLTQQDDPLSQAILAELNSPLETAYGELVRPRPIHPTSFEALDNIPTSMMHMRNSDSDNKDQVEQVAALRQERSEPSYDSADQLDNLSINDSGQLRYYGKSSGFDTLTRSKRLMKSGWIQFSSNNNISNSTDLDNKTKAQQQQRLLATVDPFELPPDDLSQHLLDLYFKTFYPWLPLIHKDAFMEKMRSPNKNRPPALLLNAIYAVASRVSSDPRVRSIPDQPDTAGDIFFERARLLMDLEWDNFKVYTVQSLLLMSSHQNGALKTVRGWLYSGMAFRMAQNLGLHRNCDSWDLTEVDKEERKRCFYCCLIVDRIASTMYGRSPVLDERDYDTLYPTYEDKDDDGNHQRPIERFQQLIKLGEILGDVLRDLYMVRGRKQLAMMTCPDYVVARLDKALNQWMVTLPADMQYRPPNTRLAERGKAPALQLCQLHMLYYTTLILLHRPFIPGSSSSSSSSSSVFPSASICTFAANKILDISESLLTDDLLDKVNNYALYFLFSAGVIFIHNAQSSDSMFAFEAKISINKIMRAMDVLEKTWSTSARHCNILGALAGLRDIDLQNVDESYYSRQKQALPPLSIAVPNSPEPMEDNTHVAEQKQDTYTNGYMETNLPASIQHTSTCSNSTFSLSPTDEAKPFDPNASAFWETPSSFDIQEWNSYLSDQAQKIGPMMVTPVIDNNTS
ncbi:fungal-specific transcription factor domain-containing protein [Chlamydoabsidia padenii]|nr:fungal-specific transcription factor domain-containing protein [Chlamydoabsidia padenii]